MPRDIPTWQVELLIETAAIIEDGFETRALKGFTVDTEFYSDVRIRSLQEDFLTVRLTAYAHREDHAFQAGVFFFGQVLDILAAKTRTSFRIEMDAIDEPRVRPRPNRQIRPRARRKLSSDEIQNAFSDLHPLRERFAHYLRACGWYRKALYTRDPYDKFLALWNAIENIGSNYHRKNDRTKAGAKNQIYDVCIQYWGEETDQWAIPRSPDWIDDYHAIRSEIAHGATSLSIDDVEKVIDTLEHLEDATFTILSEWRSQNPIGAELQVGEQ